MTGTPVTRGPGRPRKNPTPADPAWTPAPARGTLATLHRNNIPHSEPLLDPRRTSRKKGRINLKAVAEVLEARGLDPAEEILDIYESGALEPDVAARVMLTMMEYVHAKKKSVEISGPDGGPIRMEQMSDAALMRIASQALVPDVTDVEVKEMLS
jgi:hypothetical protein